MKAIAKVLAWLSLAACVVIPYLFFRGQMGEAAYRASQALASVAWFVFATYGLTKRA